MFQPCCLELRSHRGPGGSVPAESDEGEGEGLVHFVVSCVPCGAVRVEVDLAYEDAFRGVGIRERPPPPVHLVDLILVRHQRVGPQAVDDGAGCWRIGQPVGLEQRVGDVDA